MLCLANILPEVIDKEDLCVKDALLHGSMVVITAYRQAPVELTFECHENRLKEEAKVNEKHGCPCCITKIVISRFELAGAREEEKVAENIAVLHHVARFKDADKFVSLNEIVAINRQLHDILPDRVVSIVHISEKCEIELLNQFLRRCSSCVIVAGLRAAALFMLFLNAVLYHILELGHACLVLF